MAGIAQHHSPAPPGRPRGGVRSEWATVDIVTIMVGDSHGGNMQQGKAETADSSDRSGKPDSIDEADVLEKLKTVQDPDLRRDIVS